MHFLPYLEWAWWFKYHDWLYTVMGFILLSLWSMHSCFWTRWYSLPPTLGEEEEKVEQGWVLWPQSMNHVRIPSCLKAGLHATSTQHLKLLMVSPSFLSGEEAWKKVRKGLILVEEEYLQLLPCSPVPLWLVGREKRFSSPISSPCGCWYLWGFLFCLFPS